MFISHGHKFMSVRRGTVEVERRKGCSGLQDRSCVITTSRVAKFQVPLEKKKKKILNNNSRSLCVATTHVLV